jgi:pilus assembly protein Flp/PilA
MKALCQLRAEDDGATAIEYALILAAIAAVIVVLVIALGGKVRDMFNRANTGW